MLKPYQLACACAALFLLHAGGGLAAGRGGAAGPGEAQLVDFSLEQLSDIVLTSVSRQQGGLSSAPASVHVISGAEIARSGATSIPEALRLAPSPVPERVARPPQPAAPGYHPSDAGRGRQAHPASNRPSRAITCCTPAIPSPGRPACANWPGAVRSPALRCVSEGP